tara:strand:- start:4 stop:222 length:219 start_codon:yes stop_codon:yes gene_type:complete
LLEKIICNWKLLAWYFFSMHVSIIALFSAGYWVAIERFGASSLSLQDFVLLGAVSGFISFSHQAYTILKTTQ